MVLPSQHEQYPRAAWGTIILNDRPYPVAGRVSTTDLGVFPPKTTIGDHTKNSHDILSVFTLSDISGGGQVEDMNEGTDVNRFWDGTFEFRWPGMIGPAPATLKTRPDGVSPGAVCRILGDIGGRLYACWGVTPYAFNKTTRTWGVASPNLAVAPANKPVAYDGYVYIPQRTRYERVRETTDGLLGDYGTATVGGDPIDAVSFATWADRLITIETSGQITFTNDGGATWTRQLYTPTRLVRVDSSKVPRHLVPFFNQTGQPSIHIATDRQVLQYDPETPRVWPTALDFPPHQDVGLGVAVWPPGGDLWISRGTAMTRWNPQNLRQEKAGLDRQAGLPAALRGRVIDLCAEQTGLYAVLQGNTVATALPEWIEDGQDDDDPYFPDGTAYSALYVFSGDGWGRLWMSDEPTTQANWAMVSSVDGGYDLVWAVDNYAYMMTLSRENLSPLQRMEAGTGNFETNIVQRFETGWFDAAMGGQPKQAVRGVIKAAYASAGDVITCRYKLDPNQEWTLLGHAKTTGDTFIGFNYDAVGFVEGFSFERIKFEFEFTPAAANEGRTAPFMESFSLHYRKLPQDVRAYQFTVPLPSEEWDGRSGAEIDEDLRALKNSETMFRGVHNDMAAGKPLQLAIAGITGDNAPGTDYFGLRVVNVIELSDPRDYLYWIDEVWEVSA